MREALTNGDQERNHWRLNENEENIFVRLLVTRNYGEKKLLLFIVLRTEKMNDALIRN